MNLALWLERVAAVHGDRPALFTGETCVADYAAFRDRAAGVGAAGLLAVQRVVRRPALQSLQKL